MSGIDREIVDAALEWHAALEVAEDTQYSSEGQDGDLHGALCRANEKEEALRDILARYSEEC